MLINYSKVVATQVIYTPTGFDFIDQAMGGGLIQGQMIGLSGDAGAGKSTLATQLSIRLANKDKKVMYMTGEEGPGRQKKRVNRLSDKLSNPNNIDYFTPNKNGYCYVEDIVDVHKIHNHDYIFIDSLQELSSRDIKGEYKTIYGAVNILYNYLQNNSQLTIILIIQCTKAGKFAGSNKIKHKLDTMVFIDVFTNKIDNTIIGRKIRYSKNRDGETGKPYDITLSSGGLSDYKPYVVISSNKTPQSTIITAGLIGTANTSKIRAYLGAF